MARDIHVMTDFRQGEVYVLLFDETQREATARLLQEWALDPRFSLSADDAEALERRVAALPELDFQQPVRLAVPFANLLVNHWDD